MGEFDGRIAADYCGIGKNSREEGDESEERAHDSMKIVCCRNFGEVL